MFHHHEKKLNIIKFMKDYKEMSNTFKIDYKINLSY